MGFIPDKATDILSAQFSGKYIGLSSVAPNDSGTNFSELSGGGYSRAPLGTLNTSIKGQIANENIIFMFEATADVGTALGFGVFTSDSKTSAPKPFFVGSLANELVITKDHVPLIRAKKFIVGLDKSSLSSYN